MLNTKQIWGVVQYFQLLSVSSHGRLDPVWFGGVSGMYFTMGVRWGVGATSGVILAPPGCNDPSSPLRVRR